MDIKQLKNFLYENPEKLQSVLEEVGFHHIKKHSGSGDSYFTMANVDGDNPQAITVYVAPSLLTINYTRKISLDKNSSDVIDLICFARGDNLFENLKWIADKSGIGYYHRFDDDVPQSLKILKQIKELLDKKEQNLDDDDTPITPKNENILSYYFPYTNETFLRDNISLSTQIIFEIGYDIFSNSITIPIRNEVGVLCGIKARYFDRIVPDGKLKYFYLESCPKGKILYGYHITKEFIKNSDSIFITEAEKGCLQLFSYGYKNVVSTGGSKITKNQIDKLSRLGKKIIFCYDKDIKIDSLKKIASEFRYGVKVLSVLDTKDILLEKESPSDNEEKFKYIIENCLIELN